mmetsp:Transcript_30150/g.85132  ORF Transcript_30150/g.85132 Transcript_30150/m.85132 type:complete len:252 (+) Transcript_30150:315-1070(+)
MFEFYAFLAGEGCPPDGGAHAPGALRRPALSMRIARCCLCCMLGLPDSLIEAGRALGFQQLPSQKCPSGRGEGSRIWVEPRGMLRVRVRHDGEVGAHGRPEAAHVLPRGHHRGLLSRPTEEATALQQRLKLLVEGILPDEVDYAHHQGGLAVVHAHKEAVVHDAEARQEGRVGPQSCLELGAGVGVHTQWVVYHRLKEVLVQKHRAWVALGRSGVVAVPEAALEVVDARDGAAVKYVLHHQHVDHARLPLP